MFRYHTIYEKTTEKYIKILKDRIKILIHFLIVIILIMITGIYYSPDPEWYFYIIGYIYGEYDDKV